MKHLLLSALLLLGSFAWGREYSIEVVRVVDGDTIEADIQLGFGFQMRKAHIRLANANAPESNTDAGKAVKIWLSEQVLGRTCTLITDDKGETDKYGRVLGRVVLAGRDLGEALKASGRARGGPGRKDPPEPVVITR